MMNIDEMTLVELKQARGNMRGWMDAVMAENGARGVVEVAGLERVPNLYDIVAVERKLKQVETEIAWRSCGTLRRRAVSQTMCSSCGTERSSRLPKQNPMHETVAILDADLIGRKRHRFPNLACMKLSGYHKTLGDEVVLKTNYDGLDAFDRVYISKAFTDTPVPEAALKLGNVSYGGTGFFYDKAPALPEMVEHQMPDYHLYDIWVSEQLAAGKRAQEFSYYTDYSIGFLTRGCFRKCAFCVNQNYDRVVLHSPLDEFYDSSRKKICLLDDNFFGCPDWRRLLSELQATGRPFQFKQGLDERLLTDEKCAALFGSRYDGDYIFAFDNVADAALIEQKIQLARKYTNAVMKFYCFCGFDHNDRWDEDFWRQDVFNLFTRIEILMQNRCLPYVMRFARYAESPYRGVYVSVARWCNQPSFFKKKSLREFAEANGIDSACYKYLRDFEKRFPEVACFYDMKYK